MRFYLLNPASVPPNPHLFPMFIDHWRNNGVDIVDRIENADVVLFDLHSRLSDYSQSDIDYIIDNDVFCATFCEWDRGNLSIDIWPEPLTSQQAAVMNKVFGTGVHFCRLLDKTKLYPKNVYPYEKPFFYQEPICSEYDLFNRKYDVVFIANSAPSREKIAAALRSDSRLNCFISLGAEKIPFHDWVNIHRQGKLFVSSGAGGFSNERPQTLFSISVRVQEITAQLLLHPPNHLRDCIEISSPPTKEDLDTIFDIVSSKEKLYTLYKSQVEFMNDFYSPEHIATNILDTIKKHHAQS